MNEVTTVVVPPPKPLPPSVYRCPMCGGRGCNDDGMTGVCYMKDGSTKIMKRAASKCWMCLGSGKVKIEPYSGE